MSAADLPGERWRSIAGYEDRYEVSCLGRVRSLDRAIEVNWKGRSHLRRMSGRLLRRVFRRGHPAVNLASGGVIFQIYVAQLVADAFLGDRPPNTRVMHLDGEPANVAASNLAYASCRAIENGKRSRGTAPIGESNGQARLCEQIVRAIRSSGPDVTHRALADRFGVDEGSVRKVRCGETWRHVA